MKQYYLVLLESEFIYDERKKIVVKSKKELESYIKETISNYMWEYFSPRKLRQAIDEYKREPNRYLDIFSKIKYIHKRIDKDLCYDANGKKSGYTYTITYRNKEKEHDILFTLWAERILKEELLEYSGFTEIG